MFLLPSISLFPQSTDTHTHTHNTDTHFNGSGRDGGEVTQRDRNCLDVSRLTDRLQLRVSMTTQHKSLVLRFPFKVRTAGWSALECATEPVELESLLTGVGSPLLVEVCTAATHIDQKWEGNIKKKRERERASGSPSSSQEEHSGGRKLSKTAGTHQEEVVW